MAFKFIKLLLEIPSKNYLIYLWVGKKCSLILSYIVVHLKDNSFEVKES